jgi:hypothetical protein
MKKIFWAMMLTCMVILSCKKEHANTSTTAQTPDNGKYKVSFNVGFSQQTANFETKGLKVNNTTNKLATAALSDQVDVIYLAVYSSTGGRVQIIKQLSTNSGFGTLTGNFNSGTYTVVVAAGKTGLKLTNGILNAGRSGGFVYMSDSTLNTDIMYYTDNVPPVNGNVSITYFQKDAFYKKITLTVPGTTSQSVSLDRITSQVKVVVEDAIPAIAKYIKLSVDTAGLYYNVGSGKSIVAGPESGRVPGYYLTVALNPGDIGTTNYNFTGPIFLAIPKSPATITCNASSTTIIATSSIPNVSFLPNKTTVLTGNLFGGAGIPATNGFHFVADTSWITQPINKPF